MSDEILFFDSDGTQSNLPPASPTPIFTKPADNLSAPTNIPAGTIFFLAITTPHTNTWAYHGPARSFSEFLPRIRKTVSAHPGAHTKKCTMLVQESAEADEIDDWFLSDQDDVTMKEKGPPFKERGFTTFVVDHQDEGFELPGQYTILSVVHQTNAEILEMLPGPVYTVSSHGPLMYHLDKSLFRVASRGPKGFAATSGVIGACATAAEAKECAHDAMDRLVEGERGVRRTENWKQLGMGKGKVQVGISGVGRGTVMGMSVEKMWEVRVEYDGDVLAPMFERFDADEWDAAVERKAKWWVEGSGD